MKKVLSIAIATLMSVSALCQAQSLAEGDEATVSGSTRVDLMNLEAVLGDRSKRFTYGNSCLINPNGKVIVAASAGEEDKEVLVRYSTPVSTGDQCPSDVIFYLSKEYVGTMVGKNKKMMVIKGKHPEQIAGILGSEKK